MAGTESAGRCLRNGERGLAGRREGCKLITKWTLLPDDGPFWGSSEHLHLELLKRESLGLGVDWMNNLLPIHHNGPEFFVDSRDVADAFRLTHQHLRELVESHQSELERLGIFRVETGKISGKGRPERFYYLNFDQTVFLLTLTRPTQETKEYRVQLILAFRSARERFRPVDNYLSSIPERWRKTFKDEFYVALLRIYGSEFDASKNKPSWVGAWTNRFIYEIIYETLSSELKAKRQAYCATSGKDPDFIKLHQFLEEHSKDELRDHISKVTALLQLSGSKLDFAENFRSLFGGETQIRMSDLLEIN
jgi:hypothetical protein